MSDVLTEIRERLQFATDELASLRGAIGSFISASVEVWNDGSFGGIFTVKARLARPLPTSIRSKAGMIANEVRSCLDNLACRLAERNGESVGGV